MADADNTEPDGPAMQRLLDVRCHLRYIANDLHTSDRTAMHMQEVARECLEKTHSMRVLEREHEARIRADERARIAKELHRMAVAEKESDQRSAGLHEAAMFVERGAVHETPREKLRRELDALDANAKRWASPAEVRAAMNTAEVFAVAPPAEPAAPDPWALPLELWWMYVNHTGWWIFSSRAGDLKLDGDRIYGALLKRPDAQHLIDLIRRRNAAEPGGPKGGAT